MTEYTVKNDAEMEYAGSNAGNILTTTLWDQSGNIYVSINGKQTDLGVVYNEYCPIYSGDKRAVTGCTNTADAQIIYYWLEKGYAEEITLTAKATDWFRVGDYDTSSTTEGRIQLGDAAESYGVPSVAELNSILSNVSIVPEKETAFTGNYKELGDFIAALNFYCGIKNNSDYWAETSTWFGVVGAWYDGSYANVYEASGFDSYYRIAFGGSNLDRKIYSGGSFTDLGHSILRENLDYGEVIRVDIKGHSIYMDGYREGKNGYEYHLNYGWGDSYATKWYSEVELPTITGITIDLSPDINVVVSNTINDYFGGSFKRGMERVNHIQTDRTKDPVSFRFADDISEDRDNEAIKLDAVEITSKAAVDFENINVNLYTSEVTAFKSRYSMDFYLNDGSISILSSNAVSVIDHRSSGLSTVLELDDSFIYTGSYSSVWGLADLLDEYTISDLTVDFLTTVSGNAVNSTGSNNDSITLKGNSALLGSLNLGSGSDTLNVESGSVFYGGFTGTTLTVNLTVNNKETGDMLILADQTSAKGFLDAAGNTLNVSVSSQNLLSGGAYILYHGAFSENVKINLTIDDTRYGSVTSANTSTGHDDFQIVYDGDTVKLAYSVKPAEVGNITIDKSNGVECEDCGKIRGTITVNAEFSTNTYVKEYSLTGLDDDWHIYEDGVKVEKNGTVYFRATNAAGQWSEVKSIVVDCLDNEGPKAENFIWELSNSEITNEDVTISNCRFTVLDPDYSYTLYEYIDIDDGEQNGTYTDGLVITVHGNTTVKFTHYDKHGNYSVSECKITNIDKERPKAPKIVGDYTKIVQKQHIDLDGIAEDWVRIEYSLDEGDEKVWNTYTEEVLFEQNGKVYFRVIDKAGNEGDVAEYEITNIDNVAPEKPKVSADITEKTNKDVTVTAVFDLNSGDVAKIEYKVDEGEWRVCGTLAPNSHGIYTYVIKSESNHTYYFRSTDHVGNVSDETVYVVDNIDKNAPADPVYSVSEKALTNGDVLVEAYFDNTAMDIKANEYSFNGSDWYKYEDGLIFEQNGKVYFRSVDFVGNISKIVEYSVTNIDKTNPAKAVILSSSDGRITDKPIEVWADFGGRDVVKIEYSIDGSDWFEYNSEDAITATAGEVYLRAYDKAGNVTRNAVVSLNDKNMVAEMPEWSWIDPMNREVSQMEYSIDGGNEWFAYDKGESIFTPALYEYSFDGEVWVKMDAEQGLPDTQYSKIKMRATSKCGIVSDVVDVNLIGHKLPGMPKFSWNESAPDKITLRAYDKDGKISFEVESKLDENGIVTDELQWQWQHDDAVVLEYSYDKYNWMEYEVNDKRVFSENGKIYFRAKDGAGNYSAISEFKIDNIDDIVDDLNRTKIYINSKYTAKNTLGKKVGNEFLDYGDDAFASIAEAKEIKGNIDDLHVIAVGGLGETDVNALAGFKSLAAVQVEPQGSFNGEEYSYKTSGKAQKELNFSGNKYDELELDWFKKVTLSNETEIKSISGGDAVVDSYQRYSNKGKTLSRKSANTRTATGAFEASGNSKVLGTVQGYLTVDLNSSTIDGALAGGKDVLNVQSTETNDGSKRNYNISEKENASASGKAEIKKSTVGSVENYKDVVLQGADIRVVSNYKSDDSRSEVFNDTGKKFTRTITNTLKQSTDGSLNVSDSSVVGKIFGFKNVILNNSRVDSVSRVGKDGSVYNTLRENWKITSDATGKITGNLTRSVTYENGGTISVAGLNASTGNIENFSNVTIGRTVAGNITNNVLNKNDKSYVYKWLNSEAYGEHDEYSVLLEESAAEETLLKSTEKYAANGTVKVNNQSLVGNISGYDKVVLDGDGETGFITAIKTQIANQAVICGSYTTTYADTTRVRDGIWASGSLTESITAAPATSIKVTGYTVKGGIEGYRTVNAENAVVNGDIIMGNVFTAKSTSSFTTVAGVVTKNYAKTTSLTASGSLKLVNTVVTGEINCYSRVELDKKSVAGNINNTTVVRSESKYKEYWDALEQPVALDEFIDSPLAIENAVLLSEIDKVAANGSVTLKNGATAGNITGYNTVKIDSKNVDDKDGLSVGAIVANAGEAVFGSYNRQLTNKAADQTGKSGKSTETVTMAPAASVTVNGYKVAGNIAGYRSVKLEDADIAGSVILGEDKTSKTVTDYAATINGGVSEKIDVVTTYRQTGSFTAVESIVAGDITGYNMVDLKKSHAGNIWHSNITKEVSTQIWKDGTLISSVTTPTEKLSGTVKLSERASVGNITNYSSVVFNNGSAAALECVGNVTVSGAWNTIKSFTGSKGKDSMTINRNAVLYVDGAMSFGEEAGDRLTVNGTLVLKSADLTGVDTFAGKGEIAVSGGSYEQLEKDLDKKFAGSLLNLGEYVKGFRGSTFEASDNWENKAVAWDGAEEYTGWLGLGEEISVIDEVDYVKFTAEKDSILTISSESWSNGSSDSVTIGGSTVEITSEFITWELKAGGEYLIGITRKEDNSMSYSMTVTIA